MEPGDRQRRHRAGRDPFPLGMQVPQAEREQQLQEPLSSARAGTRQVPRQHAARPWWSACTHQQSQHTSAVRAHNKAGTETQRTSTE